MKDDNIVDTIGFLKSTIRSLSEQMSGDKDRKSFFSTLFESFGVDKMSDLLSKYFNTENYNDEWLKIADDKDEDERYGGVRCRMAIVFLCMWKKALLRADESMTDVEKLWGEDFGYMNSAYDSLTHTKIKFGGSAESKDA